MDVEFATTQDLVNELASRSVTHCIIIFTPQDQIGTVNGNPIYQFKNVGSCDWENEQFRGLMFGELLGILSLVRNGKKND